MYDVVIIGAGVIGSAIARELSRYQANICVIEKEEDVCNGTSKANSAIIHAGFDAKPGSLKAKLNVRGNELMDDLSKELDIPFKRNGSLVVCTKDQDRSGLDELMEKGLANGVPGLQILEREELIKIEPNLSDDVTCALFAPTGGIVCPFHMTMAFAENACTNGVSFYLNTKVTDIQKNEDGYTIKTVHTDSRAEEIFQAKLVINAFVKDKFEIFYPFQILLIDDQDKNISMAREKQWYSIKYINGNSTEQYLIDELKKFGILPKEFELEKI